MSSGMRRSIIRLNSHESGEVDVTKRESTLHILYVLAIPRSFGGVVPAAAENYSAPLSRASTRTTAISALVAAAAADHQ
jgi:hypothetical protein